VLFPFLGLGVKDALGRPAVVASGLMVLGFITFVGEVSGAHLNAAGEPARNTSISSSDPARHKSALQLDDPAMLRADPGLSPGALSPPK
jgi:hypothetical protein